MKRLLLAAAAITALGAQGAAQAQDFDGVYLGASLGYATGEDTTAEFITASGASSGFSQGFDLDGWTLGGYAGWRADTGGGWVWGVEADLDWASIEGDYRLSNGNGTDAEIGWTGTLRGVVGLTSGSTLWYATAGFAFADVEYTYVDGIVPTASETQSDTETGWTIGFGAEWTGMGGHPRVEIRYTDLGDPSHDSTVAYPGFTYEHEPTYTSIRFGYGFPVT